jgi:AraC-like DNA-binding protein
MSPETESSPTQIRISTGTRLSAANAGLFVAPGARSHPERCITTYELIFVRTGVLRLWEEERQFLLPPQHALILWPNRRHGPAAPYEPRTSFYWLHFHLEADDTSVDQVTVPQVTRVAQPLRLVELLRRFLDDQENCHLEANYASVLVKLMLLEIATQVADPESEAPQHRGKLAAIAQTALGKRFREPITTSEIARMLHCNPDYLGRVYRETFGYSLTTGIHRVRMHHAKNLLLLSSLTVKEVSMACGYENPDYFRRMFRRFFDMQPNQFRLLHPQQHTNAT